MPIPLSPRSKYILRVISDANVIDHFGLVAAMCRCLSPKESSLLLRRCAAEASNLRNTLLHKVCDDVDDTFLPLHRDLVLELVDCLRSPNPRFRQSAAYCLATLLPHLSAPHQKHVLATFLASNYVGMRRRAYKWLSSIERPPTSAVTRVWNKFHDTDYAWLIVKTFPAHFLAKHRARLLSVLTEGWQVSRLYLRIAERSPDLLSELKSRDQISYCYVLAKLGLGLSLKQAKSFIDAHAADERFGLLVWSIGRLKLWPALQYLKKQLPEIEEQKMAALRTKYGI